VGASFTHFSLFFRKLWFIINTLFSPLLEMPYAGRQNSMLKRRISPRTLFEQVIVRKTTPSEFILQGAKKILVRVR
jgi:hypothetical protein